ncbi:cytochrome P450 [Aspergillus avenaceus]|uniref:Bifunctional cytochrome P450/NADPH--P450 reductase n=1 Tax=Aspergillus avenaceus TaxID=36643 RepID=A0A5N6U5V9_ASPAV|nr:cytochrome P450 [Aspergillus avenaceus]
MLLATEETGVVPIPGPKSIPILGNILAINPEEPERSFFRLADFYGPIFRLHLAGESRVFVGNYDLVNEVCDEERFTKAVTAGLRQLRNGVHDGLFTADYPGEENWAAAHRVLIPAFGPLVIRAMYDDMYDIASQLALKWARQGNNTAIMVTDDFTRLTLDTIALCSMGTRFNSFYHEELHPFIKAMVTLLQGSADRAFRPMLFNHLPTKENKKYWEDIDFLRRLSQELVNARRNNPEDKKDLLNALILGRDPQTGLGLTDNSIIDNMMTFLIAGHETTSGMLSFLFYYFLKNPSTYKKAQEEVDTVIGRRKITVDDLSKLPYIAAAMRETLRLQSPAPLIGFRAHPTKNHEDPVILGGKYALRKGESIIIILGKLHRDPKVYGEDADDFKPERMLDDNFESLPKNAWKPFGNGMRGCIGRPFAWQEVLLVVAMLLQNFNFQMDNPAYDLRVKQTLTLKPEGFHMKATLRYGFDATKLANFLGGNVDSFSGEPRAKNDDCEINTSVRRNMKPMHIFFGSNTGTCEALARRLANDALAYGFLAKVEWLDSARENIPRGCPVVIITSSYEGQPPDNAARFFNWLGDLKSQSLDGTDYAVFGCGHHDWSATFHRVPRIIDALIWQHGGNRLCDMGAADAANSDMFSDFDAWSEFMLWPGITSNYGGSSMKVNAHPIAALQVDVSPGLRASMLGLQLQEGCVIQNTLLTAPGAPEKRMLCFQLPQDMSYQCGDYLTVLPVNPADTVRRAMRRFDLTWDASLTVCKPAQALYDRTAVPRETPISAFELLSTYVELSQPASKRDLNILADAAVADADVQTMLRSLASSPTLFTEEIINLRQSPLDLLLKYPLINLPLGNFLAMLPPMRVRQYSISSSPLQDPTTCSITFSVLNSSYNSHRAHQSNGIASTYLAELQPGERTQIGIRASNNSGFRPPPNNQTPMIMACAGSGLAPFRGFIMDRAQAPKPTQLSKAILYIGCRTKGQDDIHADELNEWASQGAVDIRWAYSRPSDGSQGHHIQDLMFEARDELAALIDQGARIYVCGGMNIGQGVRQTLKRIFIDRYRRQLRRSIPTEDEEDAAAEEYLGDLKSGGRYATDVFT